MSSNSKNLKVPLLAPLLGGRSANWSANVSSNCRNVKLPFLTTRCLYWGVDLPGDLPLWALTVEMCNILDHYILYQGGRSANMSSNSRNVKLATLGHQMSIWGVDMLLDLPIWALTVEIWNCYLPELSESACEFSVWISNCHLRGYICRCNIRWSAGATWSANMSSNSKNVKVSLLAPLQGGRSASWSANLSSNRRNMKLPFLATRCLYQGVDFPSDLPKC